MENEMIRIKKDYVMCEFHKFGEEDTFDFFYFRNSSLFAKNEFYKEWNEERCVYSDDDLVIIKEELTGANIIKNEKFILPKGIYKLTESKIDNSWEVNINGIILTELVNLLDKSHWNYNSIIEDSMEIV